MNTIGFEIASFILTCTALYLLSKPSRWSFAVFPVSLVVQMVVFWVHQQWFLFFQMIALLGFNVYNFCSWKKKGVG
jgi:hypothetical protein